MAVAMGDVPQPAVAFDVNLEPLSPAFIAPLESKLHSRFRERLNRRKKVLTADQLEEKLRLAEKRRKEQEAARLDRIHDRQKHCATMAHKMALLMEQDAKRRGLEGTEKIPAMSRHQAAVMVKSVAKDFQKIGIGLLNDQGSEIAKP